MVRRVLVFAHGNGFPAGAYAPLLELWRAAGWQVEAPNCFGHDPRYPAGPGWRRMRDELIDFIESRQLQGAVWVGHSLGGVLGLLAACQRPELPAALVMLDSLLFTGWRAQGVQLARALGLLQRLGPGAVAKHRRQEWPTHAAAHAHFAGKPLFAQWDARMLDAYITTGFDRVIDDQGERVVLRFQREIEARIYNHLPLHLNALVRRRPPRCPIGFIAGQRSAQMRQCGIGTARALAGENWRWINGTHLYPMEYPEETAQLVLKLILAMLDKKTNPTFKPS